jgi:hypothetical protein
MAKGGKGSLGDTTKQWLDEQKELIKHQERMQELHQKWLHQIGALAVQAGFDHGHTTVLPEAMRLAKLIAEDWLGTYPSATIREAITLVGNVLRDPALFAVMRTASAETDEEG